MYVVLKCVSSKLEILHNDDIITHFSFYFLTVRTNRRAGILNIALKLS